MLFLSLMTALAQSPPAEPPADEPEPVASSTTDVAKAKQLYANGEKLYEEAQYESAILAFREAYALTGQHELLYNISSAQERKGDLAGAIESLNTFRVYADEGEQESLDRKLRTLERRLDEKREAERKAAAAAAAVVAAPVPAPLVAPPAPSTQRNRLKPVLIGTGSTVAVLGGAVALGSFIAGSSADEKASYDTARVLNLTSGSVAIIGVGLAVAGLAMPNQRRAPALAVSLSPRQSSVSGTWRF